MSQSIAKIVLAGVTALCLASPANAQNSAFSALAGKMGESTSASAPTATPSASWRYQSDSAQRKKNYATTIAEAKKIDPAISEAYTAVAAADVYTVINDYLGKYGLRADDLGDVLTLAWYNAYDISHGASLADPSSAQLKAIRTQLGSMSDIIAKLSNTEKQQMADQMMLDMAVQQGALEAMRDQMPDKVPNMADAFAQYNQIFFSLDFAAMELTAKGLEADQKMPVVRKPAETKAPVAQGANLPVGHTSQILGMAYESELRFVPVGPAGSLNRDEFVTVLFKDGTACYDCQEEFLADPKMTKMRAEDPENFGKWVKRGNHYYITYPNSDDEPDEIEADGIYGPAPKDARYQGAFETSGGVSVGGMDNFTTVVSYETLLLNKDGRFAWSKESAYSGQGTGAAWGGSNAQPAARGRYFIDGFTIRLDYDDGKSETKSFIRFPKELDFLVMEGTAYWIDDD